MPEAGQDGGANPVQVRLLGAVEARCAGRQVLIGSARQRALLAILALRLNRPVSAEELIDALWGEAPPPSARSTLHSLVSRLRAALGDGEAAAAPLLTHGSAYRLDGDPELVDALRFADLCRLGRTALADGDADGASRTLRAALGLWRGPALADLREYAAVRHHADRLDEARLLTTEDLAEAELAGGRPVDALEEAESVVAAQPLRERAWAAVMLAQYRLGRPADALESYRKLRDVLAEQLGSDPTPELADLQLRIIRHDPTLGGAAARPLPRSPERDQRLHDAEGERKQVTVLFADVVRSMELAELLDADDWSQIMRELYARCADAVERFGGTVDKFTGDGVMALFGAPVAQEDHAARACHAALALVAGAQEFAAELTARSDVELAVRVGLNSGEVVTGAVGTGYTAVGHTVGLAQRMKRLADPNGVAVSEHTAALVAQGFRLSSKGPVEVKGSRVPVGVHVLEGALDPFASGRRRSGAARLVGRQSELASLCAALDRAADGEARIVGIVGEAGSGKSRLCEELVTYAVRTDVTVRRSAGVSLAAGVPLLPILNVLRDYFAIVDADSADGVRAKVTARMLALSEEFAADLGLILDLLGVPDPARPVPQLSSEARRRRVLDVLRRATERRSAALRTSLVVLEDLHWFDPDSVAFLEAWLPSFTGTRTLVVVNFRPEFRPGFAHLAGYWPLALGPLGDVSAGELVGELIGRDADLADLAVAIRRRAGGNPLFTEEIVRGLAADGTLTGEAGAYRLSGPVHQVRVPPTVQAVLAGRIDRLAARDKGVLQAASVIGRTFTIPVLGAVTGLDGAALAASVQTLCAAELLQDMPTAGECRFWHPLTQEVAYGSLLTAVRRRLHSSVASALVDAQPDRHDELATLLATHYAAGGEMLEAARWELRSATRTVRSDIAEARRRSRTALQHLDGVPDSPEALRIAASAASLLLRMGGSTGMSEQEHELLSVRARDAVERLGDPALLANYWAAEGVVRIYSGQVAQTLPALDEAMRWSEESGSREGNLWARGLSAMTRTWVGPLSRGQSLVTSVLAECGADETTGTAVIGYSVYDTGRMAGALIAVQAGELAAARAQYEDLLAALLGPRPMTQFAAWALASRAAVLFWTGECDAAPDAAQAAAECLRLAVDSGSMVMQVEARLAQGMAAALGGRPAEAADLLLAGLAEAREHRAGLYQEGTLLALLAFARLGLGDGPAARAAADEAVAVTRRQGARVVECLVHTVRARVLRVTRESADDTAAARAAVAAGLEAVAETGAATYVPFLAEEQARLDEDLRALQAVAEAYDSIGATGHARRVRGELALATM